MMHINEYLLSYKHTELVIASKDVAIEHTFKNYIEECKQISATSLVERQLLAKNLIHDVFEVTNALIDNQVTTKQYWLALSRLSVMSTVLSALARLAPKPSDEEGVREEFCGFPWSPDSDYSDDDDRDTGASGDGCDDV